MISLRPYQQDLIEKTRALMKQGCKSILIQSPTGSGKTALTAHMLHTAASRGMGSWFIVHRKELIDQSRRAFHEEGLRHGIVAAGYGQNVSEQVQIASIGTLVRRINRHRKPRLIVWDECHHLGAKTWGDVYRAFPNAYHIGLTATPQRLDGRGLGTYFQKLIEGPTVSWLIENKFLSPYKLYAPSTVNLENVHRIAGDYNKGELNQVMDKPTITGSAVEHYKKYAAGKRAIVFAVSIEHSKHIVEQFQKGGFNAAHVDGKTTDDERYRAVERFREGHYQVLSNVELFGEGFDIPAVEAAILLRPTASLGLYLQQLGRSFRPYPGKSGAIILDHVGNVGRFGLPDQDREWSLEGREKKAGEYKSVVKVCPQCFGAQNPVPRCIYCGFIFPIQSREIEQVAGDLQEIDAKQLALKLRFRKEQGMAQDFRSLVALARSRNYKNPTGWAYIIMKSRKEKSLA